MSSGFLLLFELWQPPYQVEKKKGMGVPEVGVSEEGGCCVRRGRLLQNGLPVKFKDPKFKHENFITIHAIKIGFV